MDVVALLVAIASAIAAAYSVVYARQQARSMREQLDKEHEAFMRLQGHLGTPDPGSPERNSHFWELKNIGNGDALEVRVQFLFDLKHENLKDMTFDEIPGKSSVRLQARSRLPSPGQSLHALEAGDPYHIRVTWVTRQGENRSATLTMTGVS